MRAKLPALAALIFAVFPVVCGCGGEVIITQTQTIIVPGPAITITQALSVTGPVVTATIATTVTETLPASTLTVTATQNATVTLTVSVPAQPLASTLATTRPTNMPAQNMLRVVGAAPPPPGTLRFNERVTFTVEYAIALSGGGYIMAIPFSGGNQVPNCLTSGSELLPPGTGTVSRFITVASGAINVDALRLMILDTGNNVVYENYWPVAYSFVS